jgi:hypothetical protein
MWNRAASEVKYAESAIICCASERMFEAREGWMNLDGLL